MARPDRKAAGPQLPRQSPRWPPPAFQTFASDDMASEVWRLASLAERGLLDSMKRYCWVNNTVPADKDQLARALGLNVIEVERSHGNLIAANFARHPHDETRLFCPDLERQKQEMLLRRTKQAEGGREGGKRTQAAIRKALSQQSQPSSQPSSLAKAPEMKRGEAKRSLQEGAVPDAVDDQWLRDYEGAPGS